MKWLVLAIALALSGSSFAAVTSGGSTAGAFSKGFSSGFKVATFKPTMIGPRAR